MSRTRKRLVAALAMVALLSLAYTTGDKQRLHRLMDEATAMIKSFIVSVEPAVENLEAPVAE